MVAGSNLDEVQINNPYEAISDLVDVDYSPVLEAAKKRIIACFRENSPELNLSLLKVSHLPEGLFDKLSQLKKLNIYSNSFSKKEKNFFRHLKSPGIEVIGIAKE